MKEIEKIAESFESLAEGLCEKKDAFSEIIEIWEKWFPETKFSVEAFKDAPKKIVKLFAIYNIGFICEEALSKEEAHRQPLRVYASILKRMAIEYHVDLIDIEEEMARRKTSEEDIERIKRLFI